MLPRHDQRPAGRPGRRPGRRSGRRPGRRSGRRPGRAIGLTEPSVGRGSRVRFSSSRCGRARACVRGWVSARARARVRARARAGVRACLCTIVCARARVRACVLESVPPCVRGCAGTARVCRCVPLSAPMCAFLHRRTVHPPAHLSAHRPISQCTRERARTHTLGVCMLVHAHLWTCARAHTCLYARTRTLTDVRARARAHTHTHTHTCMRA